MNDLQERIAQWEKMTTEAPDAMAWLSLANTYREADRLDDAAAAYTHAIECNDQMSRAYELLGQTLIDLGRTEQAGQTLTQGYKVATTRGDRMPQKAIAHLLEKLNLPLPEIEQAQEQVQLTGDEILDRLTGKPGHRLPEPPMRGPTGRFIADHFSQETWRQWITQGTKVINELRLDFSNEEHQRIYDQHMFEWLGITQQQIDDYQAKNPQ